MDDSDDGREDVTTDIVLGEPAVNVKVTSPRVSYQNPIDGLNDATMTNPTDSDSPARPARPIRPFLRQAPISPGVSADTYKAFNDMLSPGGFQRPSGKRKMQESPFASESMLKAALARTIETGCLASPVLAQTGDHSSLRTEFAPKILDFSDDLELDSDVDIEPAPKEHKVNLLGEAVQPGENVPLTYFEQFKKGRQKSSCSHCEDTIIEGSRLIIKVHNKQKKAWHHCCFSVAYDELPAEEIGCWESNLSLETLIGRLNSTEGRMGQLHRRLLIARSSPKVESLRRDSLESKEGRTSLPSAESVPMPALGKTPRRKRKEDVKLSKSAAIDVDPIAANPDSRDAQDNDLDGQVARKKRAYVRRRNTGEADSDKKDVQKTVPKTPKMPPTAPLLDFAGAIAALDESTLAPRRKAKARTKEKASARTVKKKEKNKEDAVNPGKEDSVNPGKKENDVNGGFESPTQVPQFKSPTVEELEAELSPVYGFVETEQKPGQTQHASSSRTLKKSPPRGWQTEPDNDNDNAKGNNAKARTPSPTPRSRNVRSPSFIQPLSPYGRASPRTPDPDPEKEEQRTKRKRRESIGYPDPVDVAPWIPPKFSPIKPTLATIVEERNSDLFSNGRSSAAKASLTSKISSAAHDDRPRKMARVERPSAATNCVAEESLSKILSEKPQMKKGKISDSNVVDVEILEEKVPMKKSKSDDSHGGEKIPMKGRRGKSGVEAMKNAMKKSGRGETESMKKAEGASNQAVEVQPMKKSRRKSEGESNQEAVEAHPMKKSPRKSEGTSKPVAVEVQPMKRSPRKSEGTSKPVAVEEVQPMKRSPRKSEGTTKPIAVVAQPMKKSPKKLADAEEKLQPTKKSPRKSETVAKVTTAKEPCRPMKKSSKKLAVLARSADGKAQPRKKSPRKSEAGAKPEAAEPAVDKETSRPMKKSPRKSEPVAAEPAVDKETSSPMKKSPRKSEAGVKPQAAVPAVDKEPCRPMKKSPRKSEAGAKPVAAEPAVDKEPCIPMKKSPRKSETGAKPVAAEPVAAKKTSIPMKKSPRKSEAGAKPEAGEKTSKSMKKSSRKRYKNKC